MAQTPGVVTATVENGAVVIPAELREWFSLKDGSNVSIEAGQDGILIRPLDYPDVEIYTPERIAEFLLNNALDEVDYAWAVEEVRAMGLDPDTILHEPSPQKRS